jgi:hypothetical protein
MTVTLRSFTHTSPNGTVCKVDIDWDKHDGIRWDIRYRIRGRSYSDRSKVTYLDQAGAARAARRFINRHF